MRWGRRHRALITLAMSLVGSVLAGCGGDEGGQTSGNGSAGFPAGTYVGRVSGSDAYIALITDGERVAGYLCDGDEASTWLRSSGPHGESAELLSREGADLGSVTFDENGARGEVELEGERRGFSAEPAEGEAGLYRAAKGGPGKPGSAEAGWIVLADGSQRGATNIRDGTSNITDGTSNTVVLSPPHRASMCRAPARCRLTRPRPRSSRS